MTTLEQNMCILVIIYKISLWTNLNANDVKINDLVSRI